MLENFLLKFQELPKCLLAQCIVESRALCKFTVFNTKIDISLKFRTHLLQTAQCLLSLLNVSRLWPLSTNHRYNSL
jgi:hypothetical protein